MIALDRYFNHINEEMQHRTAELSWKAAAPIWNYKDIGAWNNAQVHVFSIKLVGQGTGNSCQIIFLGKLFLKDIRRRKTAANVYQC